MKQGLLLIFLFFASTVQADPFMEKSLTVQVADQNLRRVLNEIAWSIEKIKDDFPQLKKWNRALILADRIEFHDRDCDLVIFSKKEPLFNEHSETPMELKVGVYLKMKAVGKKAKLLKEALLQIIENKFQRIRRLHNQKGGATFWLAA